MAALCDEILGPHKGQGRSASWPCPSPGHPPQTGKTPPLSLYDSPTGDVRYHCHGCGIDGTAIDLVKLTQGTDFRGALEMLARRSGVREAEPDLRPMRRQERPRAPQPRSATPDPRLDEYVASCVAHLWSRGSLRFRGYLMGTRGLSAEVLKANLVGVDPGPARLEKTVELPWSWPVMVFPLLDADGRPVFVQARSLRPGAVRFINARVEDLGASPRLSHVRLPTEPVRPDVVVLCEGFTDAFSVGVAGYRSVAILGQNQPTEALVERLLDQFPREAFIVSFDADAMGVRGRDALLRLLEAGGATGRLHTLALPADVGDVNDWLCGAGRRFRTDFTTAVESALGPGIGCPMSAMSLEDVRPSVLDRLSPPQLENAAGVDLGL